MKILGISAFYHDSAAAIIEDGKIIAAAQEERFTRKKHDAAFPTNAVQFCLEFSGNTIDDLDGIALLMGHERKELVDWACEQKIISEEESGKLLEALTALYDVLRVDAFDADGIKKLTKTAKGKRKVVERTKPKTAKKSK